MTGTLLKGHVDHYVSLFLKSAIPRVLVNARFGEFYSNFLSLTSIFFFCTVSIEKYNIKTQLFLDGSMFTLFKTLVRIVTLYEPCHEKAFANRKGQITQHIQAFVICCPESNKYTCNTTSCHIRNFKSLSLASVADQSGLRLFISFCSWPVWFESLN